MEMGAGWKALLGCRAYSVRVKLFKKFTAVMFELTSCLQYHPLPSFKGISSVEQKKHSNKRF